MTDLPQPESALDPLPDAAGDPAAAPAEPATLAPETAAAPPPDPVALPPDPVALPPDPVAVPPGLELPTARQVVGRGLQLAYDSTRDLRRASLYIGLLVLAVAGPFVVLLLADIPRVAGVPFDDLQSMSRDEAEQLLAVIGPLYGAGMLAALGLVAVSIDASLMAVAVLASRAVGRPMRLREAVRRARQVYWRYGVAAFIVALISGAVSAGIQVANGSLGRPDSLGVSLVGSFVATLVVMPFSYIATATVVGDVTGGAALGRSVTLVRARPRLGFTIAAFAFGAAALQTFGLGAAVGVADNVVELLHPSLDLAGPGLLVVVPVAALGLVALGSLVLTVAAITAAPQVAAFLGLTHFSAGLDRAREPVAALAGAAPDVAPAASAGTSAVVAPAAGTSAVVPAADAPAPASGSPSTYWDQPIVDRHRRARWVTVPMIGLVLLEALIVVAALIAGRA